MNLRGMNEWRRDVLVGRWAGELGTTGVYFTNCFFLC